VTCWFKLFFKERIVSTLHLHGLSGVSISQWVKLQSSPTLIKPSAMLLFIPKSLSVKTNKQNALGSMVVLGSIPNSIHHDVVRLLLEAPSPDAMILEDSPLSEG